ncbi:hypothetical protein [Streptomyces sp. CBMA152]|uniref:hypothetical protein n=1 Tax=Streptomyces sp. CBMA152 TaxID=1896312 RepID=UPI001CB757C1|nr:hypothetical protein [Streptomyces sp. CBMA152]
MARRLTGNLHLLARRMSEDPHHTLGSVLARLEAREQQIATQVGPPTRRSRN